MTAADSSEPAWISPRVLRTKAHVLTVARTLLAELGPVALTYTRLGEAAGVTRQTLYRHWPTRQILLRDVVISAPHAPAPVPGTDPAAEVFAFLTTLRSGMNTQSTAAALMTLASSAPHDSTSSGALIAITDARRAALNIMLSNTGQHVTAAQFARLCGPVIFQSLIARAEVTDAFIRSLIAAWQQENSDQTSPASAQAHDGR